MNMSTSNTEDLDQYFEFAKQLVRKAGEMVNEAITSRNKKSKKKILVIHKNVLNE